MRAEGRIGDDKYVIGPTLQQAAAPAARIRDEAGRSGAGHCVAAGQQNSARLTALRDSCAPVRTCGGALADAQTRRCGGSGSEENRARDRGENIVRFERTAPAPK